MFGFRSRRLRETFKGIKTKKKIQFNSGNSGGSLDFGITLEAHPITLLPISLNSVSYDGIIVK